MQNIWSYYQRNAPTSVVWGGSFQMYLVAGMLSLPFFSRQCHICTDKAQKKKKKKKQRQLMRTIFVPSQRTRSPSHNCQSSNKSLCGTNECSIGNETKLIGMLCQLDSIHPFHTRPFICEAGRGRLSLWFTLTLTVPHWATTCAQLNTRTWSGCKSYMSQCMQTE